MGKLTVGQVVSCAFPFSDLSAKKVRPALVVAVVDFDDVILCQITSKAYASTLAIKLQASDFASGGLPVESYIRPDKLFTADATMAGNVYGSMRSDKIRGVQKAVQSLFV